jgi:5-formyltetrahydrofolate cyclo-ligase
VGGDLERAKQRLRGDLLRRRRGVAREVAEAAGHAVAGHLAGCAPFRAATRVGLYAALPDELPTRPCFEALRARGAETLLPRVEAGALVFRVVARWEELRTGRYGVLEPPPEAPERPARLADLLLVPGVAFDARGNRLGRGGGHYDAALAAASGGPRVFGVGYELQVVTSVPHGSRDRRVDAIVTESGIRWVESG